MTLAAVARVAFLVIASALSLFSLGVLVGCALVCAFDRFDDQEARREREDTRRAWRDEL